MVEQHLHYIQQLRHRDLKLYHKRFQWRHLICKVWKQLYQLQQQQLLVIQQRQLIKLYHCFFKHWLIQCFWIQLMMSYKHMFHQHLCMGKHLLIQYRIIGCMTWHMTSNHHRILDFRMILSNQLIVVQRMKLIFHHWRWSWHLLMNLQLRKPSMIHMNLGFWRL